MIRRISVAIMLVCMISSPAFAKHHHKHHYKKIHHHRIIIADDEQIVSHPSGCPHIAFCGCGVSVEVFGHPVRNLFPASAWYKYPRAIPAPGMVAVRSHHVMLIKTIDANGNAVVYDPNSGGHLTRIHTVSLAGFRIVNPHSNKVAYELPKISYY